MDENIRFMAILDELKNLGLAKDYVDIAKAIGTNKAAISDIKGGRKKLSIQLLRSLKISYPKISIEWVVTGNGDMLISNVGSISPGVSPSDDKLVDKLLNKVQAQAEEIGTLRERVRQLEDSLPKTTLSADDVGSQDAALVG